MRLLLPLLLCLSLILATSPLLADSLTGAKKAGIRHLMMLTGASQMGPNLSSQLAKQLRQALDVEGDKVPEQLNAIIDFEVKQLMEERFELLESKLVHIYAKHFSHDEIKQLIAFYRSDIGKKSMTELPAIIDESRETGQEWGQAMVTELVKRIDVRLSATDLHLTQ